MPPHSQNGERWSIGTGWGWLDGIASNSWGILPYQTTRVEQQDDELRYQFDNLSASNNYSLNLTFYQPMVILLKYTVYTFPTIPKR